MMNVTYIKEYYPQSVITRDEDALENRKLIQDFMQGELNPQLKSEIIKKVHDIALQDDIDVVCFEPGLTSSETLLRYEELSSQLVPVVDCDVFMDTLTLEADADPITQEFTFKCNETRVKDKNILLIGGVYDSGLNYIKIVDILINNKAKKVVGLYIAKVKR